MDKALFDDLLASVKEMDQIRRGKRKPARMTVIEPVAVKKIREQTGLSQGQFATMLNISDKTLKNWEQGRRAPDGPALALLKVVDSDPRAVLKALHGEAPSSQSRRVGRSPAKQRLRSTADTTENA